MTANGVAGGPRVPAHGGDRSAVAAVTGVPVVLDLGTGINPWPYPLPALDGERWSRLPDSAEEERLAAAAAGAYGVADRSLVVAGPGTQALIQWLPRLRSQGAVAVVGPTYGEHAASWSAAGHDVAEAADLPGARGQDVVVLTNPNNPDGRRHAPEAVLALADALARTGGWLVVDEAFADVAPELSVAPSAGRDGLIVLRSFGKLFGLAGLRLGFALCPVEVAAALRKALGPWPVSGPAIAVGAQALADRGWIEATRRRLANAAAALDARLTACGLEVIGGTDLFRLVRCPDAHRVYRRLAERGVLVRCFAGRGDWLRIGLPPGRDELAEFERTLAAALERPR